MTEKINLAAKEEADRARVMAMLRRPDCLRGRIHARIMGVDRIDASAWASDEKRRVLCGMTRWQRFLWWLANLEAGWLHWRIRQRKRAAHRRGWRTGCSR